MLGLRARTASQRPLLQSFRRYASDQKKIPMRQQFLGVSVDLYIHPAKQNLPSWFSSPKLRFRGIIRRLSIFFQNTVMIAQFRLKSRISPRFQEWKNLAIENYVATNQAFVKGNLDAVKDSLSIWTFEALKARRQSLPKGTKLDWKLLKFNSVPRVMAIQPMMLPDVPLRHILIVYRMNTRQRLVKSAPGEKEPQKIDRDVVDYVAFIYDASKTPAETTLAGSLFETPLAAPRPNPMAAEQSEGLMIQSMREKGDIFRSPPTLPSN